MEKDIKKRIVDEYDLINSLSIGTYRRTITHTFHPED